MNTIHYQITNTGPFETPATPAAARLLLEKGSRDFAELGQPHGDAPLERRLSPLGLGLSAEAGKAPDQQPFAAILSCADARVPVEWLFSQAANAIFVLRVAGNLLTTEVLGSFHYAVEHLPSVRLLVVLGHTGCGAVGAAAKAHLAPESYLELAANPPLRAVVDPLMAPIHQAAQALSHAHGEAVSASAGYRAGLADLAATINAAQIAHTVNAVFQREAGYRLEVVFGVYNLANRLVGLPARQPTPDWQPGLFPAPASAADFDRLTGELAASGYIQHILTA